MVNQPVIFQISLKFQKLGIFQQIDHGHKTGTDRGPPWRTLPYFQEILICIDAECKFN